MNSGDRGEQRKTWVRAKFGNMEVEAQGFIMILFIGSLMLQGVLAWAMWQHMLHSMAQTIAFREMICLLREDPTDRKAVANWCSQQARFGTTADQSGALAAPRPWK